MSKGFPLYSVFYHCAFCQAASNTDLNDLGSQIFASLRNFFSFSMTGPSESLQRDRQNKKKKKSKNDTMSWLKLCFKKIYYMTDHFLLFLIKASCEVFCGQDSFAKQWRRHKKGTNTLNSFGCEELSTIKTNVNELRSTRLSSVKPSSKTIVPANRMIIIS